MTAVAKRKSIAFSRHSLARMPERGITKEEVVMTVHRGERSAVKNGRNAYRMIFTVPTPGDNQYDTLKQVMLIAVEKEDSIFVLTVYACCYGDD